MGNRVKKLRQTFTQNDNIRDQGLQAPAVIKRYDNITYGPYGVWNKLDVYTQTGNSVPMPTIVSIHGGAWIYGDKERYQYYCMDLAVRGFTVVNFSYRLAPENQYPAVLEDINEVFNWITEYAEEYQIDCDNLFVVGDSAGAQLAAQYITMISNPDYAKRFDFQIPAGKFIIRATALNCGVYDLNRYIKSEEGWIMDKYLGDSKDVLLPELEFFQYLRHNFPPCFLMTARYDHLKQHTAFLYEKFTSLQMQCKYKVYGEEGQSYMGHVFHVNIRLKEAKECNDEECEFFRNYILSKEGRR